MKNISFLTLAVSALALAACGNNDTSSAPTGEAVAKIAAPAGKQWVDVVTKTPEGGYLVGNPDAKVRLIEYGSVTCSHCAEFKAEAFDELQSKYIASGQANFEFRNFLLNPYDIPISILTRCAGEGPYLALTEQFYTNQRPVLDAMSKTDPAIMQAALKKPENERFVALGQAMGVIEFFKERGVSEDQAKACLSDPKNAKELIDMTEKAADPAGSYKVTGTPSFFLNGAPIEIKPTPSVWTQVKTAMQNAGAR